jgi:SAM-dependent methyltransferase
MALREYKKTYLKDINKSIGFLGVPHNFFLQVKAGHLRQIAQKHFKDTSKLSILDVGCGVGLAHRYLIPHFQKLTGIDIEKSAISSARSNHPKVPYLQYDGKQLPFEKGTFDITFAICVMHHVNPLSWRKFLKEMKRVTRPNGLVVVFEHNPWNFLTLKAVNSCELDRDANLLTFPTMKRLFVETSFKTLQSAFIIFFPWRGRIFRFVERFLSWLPLGSQYYFVGKKY